MDNDTFEDNFRRLKKNIQWSEKLVNVFCPIEELNLENDTGNKEKKFINNLIFLLKDRLAQNADNESNIKDIQKLNISFFSPTNYNKNHEVLLNELSNNIFIIDCTKLTNESKKDLGQLTSFYYMAKEYKTTFIYVFNKNDIANYVTTEMWQQRSLVLNFNPEDLVTYQMFKEMSAKYIDKKPVEKKIKI